MNEQIRMSCRINENQKKKVKTLAEHYSITENDLLKKLIDMQYEKINGLDELKIYQENAELKEKLHRIQSITKE